MADGAYWFEDATGDFVSSTYYGASLPAWVANFNRERAADKFLSAEWKPLGDTRGEVFTKMAEKPRQPYYAAMERTPYGNELLVMLAERGIVAEKLGQRNATDVLSISFSSNDYVGHDYGPDSPRVRDISIRTDRLLARLFDFVEKHVGMRNVVVVMTADHGVSPLPELMAERRMPGGRMSRAAMHKRIEDRLTGVYGPGKWILGRSGPAPYLDLDLIRRRKLDPAEVREHAAEAVRELPNVARVYTRDQLAKGQVPGDPMDRRVLNGFHAQRASDLFIVNEPYYMFEEKGTSHGTPYHYDTHVPIVFLGPGFKPGRYVRQAAVNDIAPTLAVLLEIETPSGSVGRVLEEALASQ
jgi:predicted AlkP superfamily pyrophosphatase or phosphodiesterase